MTLYIIGFTEAIFSAFPGIELSFRTTATLTNIAVFVCVFIGAGWTIRIQYGILAVLLLFIGSFFVGAWNHASMETLTANLQARWTDEHSLFTIFALFFPAVTGIMAGVNMSGDLKGPSRSIPRGTFAAVAFTAIIYAGSGRLPGRDVSGQFSLGSRSDCAGGGFFFTIKRAEIVVQWGDLGSGLAFRNARKALLRLEKEHYWHEGCFFSFQAHFFMV